MPDCTNGHGVENITNILNQHINVLNQPCTPIRSICMLKSCVRLLGSFVQPRLVNAINQFFKYFVMKWFRIFPSFRILKLLRKVGAPNCSTTICLRVMSHLCVQCSETCFFVRCISRFTCAASNMHALPAECLRALPAKLCTLAGMYLVLLTVLGKAGCSAAFRTFHKLRKTSSLKTKNATLKVVSSYRS